MPAAIDTYDDALSLVADSDELERHGVPATLLLAKGRVLGSHHRREEAIIDLDSALSAIRSATARQPALRTRQAAVAVAYKLGHLYALDRFAEAGALMTQLRVVLGEIPDDARDAAAPRPTEPSALAAALAEIVNDDQPWKVFAGSIAISAAD